MVWKFTGERPVYQQIMEQIQGAVLSGEFAPGERIPSVRDLATQAQVNPNTMQHALHELEQQGLLVASGTTGRYVTEDASVVEQLRACRLRALAAECAQRFAAFGLSPAQAAQCLLQLQDGKEDIHE